MLRIVIAGMRAHVGRTLLAAAAVTLGAGFFAGTLIYADTARAALADDFARPGAGVDVIIDPTGDDTGTLHDSDLREVAALPGVALADPRTRVRLPVLG